MSHLLEATVLERLLGGTGKGERRATERFEANGMYAVAAPYDHLPLPGPDLQFQVKCRDLSRRGVAFYWPKDPATRYVLIGLGRAPHTSYVMAQIVSSLLVPGEARHLVRCEFLRKADM